mmetsp:Transcript_18276/g.42619  ORF Transcript_18276/g.42619 Transcript_18276/m.42619 type:complete len:271 (+) Transcript_18276:1857-2669(+)
MCREQAEYVRHYRRLASTRRCNAKHQLRPWMHDGIYHLLLNVEGLEDGCPVFLCKRTACQKRGPILQVPKDFKVHAIHGSLPEPSLEVKCIPERKQTRLRRIRLVITKFCLVLPLQHTNAIGQGLCHLIVLQLFYWRVLLLFGRVLQRQATAYNVRNLKLPRRLCRNILLLKQVHPSFHCGALLLRLAIYHVLDEVLSLQFLFGVELHYVLLLLFVRLLVVLLLFLLVLLTIIFFLAIILFIFFAIILLVLFVFLVIVLLLQRKCWHELH